MEDELEMLNEFQTLVVYMIYFALLMSLPLKLKTIKFTITTGNENHRGPMEM